jgi:hypothetical protein
LIEISVQIIAKSNAKMTQPRRVRIITPLGKDAVVLVDSNGKALKHAGKGFTNHFKNVVIEGHEQDHGAGGGLLIDDVSSQSSASITNVNDIGDLNVDGGGSIGSSIGTPGRMGLGVSTDQHHHHHGSGAGAGAGAGGESRSPSRASRGGRRDGTRSRAGRSAGKGKGGDMDTYDHDMQAKLVVTWQTIELSSHKKLMFMQKYSTDMYSVELGRATDLWAEAAVYVMARTCCLKLATKFFVSLFIFVFRPPNNILIIFLVSCFVARILCHASVRNGAELGVLGTYSSHLVVFVYGIGSANVSRNDSIAGQGARTWIHTTPYASRSAYSAFLASSTRGSNASARCSVPHV